MACNARKFVRVTKFLLAGVTVFCVSWIACVGSWHGGVRWRVRPRSPELSTMRTIVAYSEGKQAELDRPSPVTCDSLPAFPKVPHINRTWTPESEWKSSWQDVAGTRVSLYAAYYDERLPQRYIRILASFQDDFDEAQFWILATMNDELPLVTQNSSLNDIPPYQIPRQPLPRTTIKRPISNKSKLQIEKNRVGQSTTKTTEPIDAGSQTSNAEPGCSSRNFSEEPLYCQTRQLNPYEDSVEVVAARPLEIWYRQWDVTSKQVETPVLLSCPLTGPLYFPSIVSVVTEPCDDPTNAFSIEPSLDAHYKRNFTICVKDLNFNRDISRNLIEWIETNKVLGVDMIDMYIDSISKDSENVLLHYRSKGYVRVFHVPIKDKPKRSLWQRRRDHIITYNDCLYRNIGESVYVVPLDIDEIVLPKIAYTWAELIERLKYNGWDPVHNSAILVQNVFFFDFMQGVHSYKHKRPHASKNKIYVKRDDVRIKRTGNVEVGEIELFDDINSLSNEVIDNSENREIYEKYKKRCGEEFHEPKLVKHTLRSALVSPVGYYGKSLMVTRKVLTAFNHYPLASLRGAPFSGWSAPFEEVQLNHYKESCNTTMVAECTRYGRRARLDIAALRLRTRLTTALANAICTTINNT